MIHLLSSHWAVQLQVVLFPVSVALPRMGLNEKIQFANRKAVGAGGKRQLVVQPPSEKNGEERQLMEKALKKNENIQTMVTWSKSVDLGCC